jgi:digeranylgeranylglycerophospholipid reductase
MRFFAPPSARLRMTLFQHALKVNTSIFMSDKYDCIVVGAGPAGSMAGKVLAENGVDVLVLEKHPEVGSPLSCAEAISFSGLTSFVPIDPEWLSSQVNKVLLVSPSSIKMKIYHPNAGFILNRKLFDKKLAERATLSGACVKVNAQAVRLLQNPKEASHKKGKFCGVGVLENGKEKEYQAKVIIGADGVESCVARWAGMNFSLQLDRIQSCVQYLLGDVEVESDCLEFHLGQSLAPGGYAWVFPKGNNRANVGLAVTPERTSEKKAKEYLGDFVARRFSNFKIIESMMGAVPCFDRNKNLVKENVLLVGDAGRVIDSLSGAGISNALLSGKIAGSVVSRYIKDGGLSASFLKKYHDELMRSKGGLLRFYSFCRAVFLKMTDEDFDAVILFLKRCFDGKVVTGIEPIPVVKSILRSNPKLLFMLRHLVW